MSKLKACLLPHGMHGTISQVDVVAKVLDIEFIHYKGETNNILKIVLLRSSPISHSVYKKIN